MSGYLSGLASALNVDAAAAKVDRCQNLLRELEEAEGEWINLEWERRSPSPFPPTFGRDGKPTPQHAEMVQEILRERRRRRAAMVSRRDKLREAIRSLASELLPIAVLPEIGEQPAKLRSLMESWNP